MSDTKVGFIGFGNMARYLCSGINASPENIMVAARSEATLNLAKAHYGTHTGTIKEVVGYADVIFLCVKPNNLEELPKEFMEEEGFEKLLISVLAGTSVSDVEHHAWGFGGHILRLMPNLGVAVGEGAVSAYGCCGSKKHLCDTHKELANEVLSGIGEITYIKESHMDASTAIFGSGPAYVCKFIELFADAAVLQGIGRADAYSLAIQTFYGTAALLKYQGGHPAVIREQVCSPGGVAITGLDKMREQGLDSCIIEALVSATEKAKSLG